MRPSLLLLLLLAACASSRSSAPGGGAQAFGTPHPFVLQVASPDGRWLIGCQAREDTDEDGRTFIFLGMHGDIYGDELVPYLFLEPGPGKRIDDFIHWDPSGRFLVVVRDSSLRLLDTQARHERELTRLQPSPHEKDDAFSPPPVAQFSRDGQRLIFLRKQEGKVVAVVRELSSGHEQLVDAGPGASFDPSGTWVLFQVLAEDTDEDGTLRWPVEETNLAPSLCRGPVMSYTQAGWTGDRPVFRMRRVEGGPLYEGGDVLQPVGPYMLRRGAQGELLVEDASGQRTEWVPAECKGRLLHADPERQLLIVACTSSRQPWDPVELHGASIHQPLGLKVRAPYRDKLLEAPTRLVQLRGALFDVSVPPGKDPNPAPPEKPFLLDLEQRTLHPVTADEVVSTRGALALLSEHPQRGDLGDDSWRRRVRLSLLNAATGGQTVLAESLDPYKLEAGPLILYAGVLVDMEAGQMLGRIPQHLSSMLALDTQKRVLRIEVPPERYVGMGEGALGPVHWEPLPLQ
jgi:hypothetical protein